VLGFGWPLLGLRSGRIPARSPGFAATADETRRTPEARRRIAGTDRRHDLITTCTRAGLQRTWKHWSALSSQNA